MGAFLSRRPLLLGGTGAVKEGRQSSFFQPKNVVPSSISGKASRATQTSKNALRLGAASKHTLKTIPR